MERFHQLLAESDKLFKTADHLAYVTYPMLKEVKLTLTITKNLYGAMTKAMDAVLEYDRYYKNIFSLPEDFNSRLHIFCEVSIPRYKINQKFVKILKTLRSIVEGHKSSPIEIVRNNKFVIFSESYTNMQIIDIETLKKYIYEIRPVLEGIYKLGV